MCHINYKYARPDLIGQAESLESRNEIQNRGYGVEKSEAAGIM